MAIKVMLIEDEAGMRLLLKKIIEKHSEFQVVAECDEIAESVIAFRRQAPEVVFLDIGIKGQNGIECARILCDLDPKVKIIFATAHAEYMPEAFELYAFDYLVKPFDVERVNRTLNRIGSGLKPKEIPAGVRRERGSDRLLIKGKESASFVETADIVLIQREEGNTVIYTTNDNYVTSAALSELEARLDPMQFMRSHKSYIINVSKIKRIEPYGRWTYIVLFKDLKKDALITAEKYEELKRRYD